MASRAPPEHGGVDCKTAPGNNGRPCKHCKYHIGQLAEAGVRHPGLSYPAGTYPVIFYCQFIYRYDAVDPEDYCVKMFQQFAEAIRKEYGRDTPIYEHVRMYKGESVWEQDQQWTCWVSFLVDMPRPVKVNGLLRHKLGLDEIAPKDSWSFRDHWDDPAAAEDFNWARLSWFMKNEGIYHHDAICNESFIDYHNVARVTGAPGAQVEMLENMVDYGH